MVPSPPRASLLSLKVFVLLVKDHPAVSAHLLDAPRCPFAWHLPDTQFTAMKRDGSQLVQWKQDSSPLSHKTSISPWDLCHFFQLDVFPSSSVSLNGLLNVTIFRRVTEQHCWASFTLLDKLKDKLQRKLTKKSYKVSVRLSRHVLQIILCADVFSSSFTLFCLLLL